MLPSLATNQTSSLNSIEVRSVGTRTLSTRPEQHQGHVHMQLSRSGSLESCRGACGSKSSGMPCLVGIEA
jgi:hypothetical protein